MPIFFDNSKEFILKRYQHGIQLSRPDSRHDNLKRTIGDVLNANLNIYFLAANGHIKQHNETHAEAFGLMSVKDGLEKSIAQWATKQSALICQQNDLEVMRSQNFKIIEETMISNKSTNANDFTGLTIKMPWYSHENKIIGVFGCTTIYGLHSLPQSLTMLKELGLLNYFESKAARNDKKIAGESFSYRQLQIIKLVIRGKYSKEISNILGLSQRTIQHYIDNIKDKLNVRTRSQLIDKIFDDFKNEI